MSLGFVSGKEAEKFREEVPYSLAQPPWNYNESLIQGIKVTC